MDQSFKKEERLHSKKIIDLLFEKGASFSIGSIRTIWLKSEPKQGCPVKVLIAVPKKNISGAIQRNKLKRRIREAYRKNKSSLLELLNHRGNSISLAFVYTQNEVIAYQEIEDKIILSLQRLSDMYEVDAD
jgi:ribonuclease P protein component